MAEFLLNPDGATPPAAGEASAAGDRLVVDSDTAHFVDDVIRVSSEAPVLVDFWAPWCGPCKQLGPLLERLVRQAGGLVRLVKINVDENQELAAQLRIQSIPAVFAFKDGRPVDGFVGAQPESQLRAFIGRLTAGAKLPLEAALEQAQATLAAGDAAGAAQVYAEILAHDPGNPAAVAGQLRCALAAGDLAEARHLADSLAPEQRADGAVAAALNALELAEQGGEAAADTEALRRRLDADPGDHQARLDLAVALYGAGDAAAAIEELLELVRRDRAWNDEAARRQLLKIFDALGPADPLTVAGRRGLSSILFS